MADSHVAETTALDELVAPTAASALSPAAAALWEDEDKDVKEGEARPFGRRRPRCRCHEARHGPKRRWTKGPAPERLLCGPVSAAPISSGPTGVRDLLVGRVGISRFRLAPASLPSARHHNYHHLYYHPQLRRRH